MKIFVGKRPVPIHTPMLESHVHELVSRARRPFVVRKADGSGFRTLPRVFLTTEAGARVECEDENELRFACRLVAEESSLCRDDNNLECVRETEAIERTVKEFMNDPTESEEEGEVKEEEDISIEEWGQLGYKWFKNDEVHYI
jgi:hypothetical protein